MGKEMSLKMSFVVSFLCMLRYAYVNANSASSMPAGLTQTCSCGDITTTTIATTQNVSH
jgi:hypothetical protein